MSDHRRIHFFGDYLNGLNRACSAVEIGVNKGEYLFSMVSYCPKVFWFGVDPYTQYETYSHLITINPKEGWSNMYATLIQKISSHPAYNRIRLVRKKSADALDEAVDNLDFVYIDGNHSYDAVMEDITLWEPKVRPGGILAGHDYNKTSKRHKEIFGGLIKAVNEYAATNNRDLKLDVSGNWYWWVK